MIYPHRMDGESGTRALGPDIIATAEEPGEPGSVINWRGVNYVPQPEPTESEELVQRLRDLETPL